MTLPKVTEIERIVVRVPFRSPIARWNSVLIGNWQVIEVVRVETEDPDVVGYGETMIHYAPQVDLDAASTRVIGANPGEFLAEDQLGAGLQMALFDIVGKASGVPVHRLFGQPLHRRWCPISWWSTKMPAELLASEAAVAVQAGYLAHKIKARPWFDIREQVASIAAATPPDFRIDIDWNAMLLQAPDAYPVLRDLAREERVAIFEDPISRTDVAGQKALKSMALRPMATHFDPVLFPTWMRDDAQDGFVVDGGVSAVLQAGALCAGHNKSLWLQNLGTGITTAMSLQLTSVLSHARWPLVTAMNIFEDDLLTTPLVVRGGYAMVPDEPGLGIVVDEGALARLRMEAPYTIATPRRIHSFRLADGRTRHYASIDQLWRDCRPSGTMPVQSRGARLDLQDDDGSAEFQELYLRASESPVWDTALA